MSCRAEQAQLEDGNYVLRPVIRLDSPPVILTRIKPDVKETSMILRPRPNWEELRAVLAGDQELGPDGKPKLRCGRHPAPCVGRLQGTAPRPAC